MCGTFQRNEYARYARDNARKQGRVLCITGVGTLFRVSALRAVAGAIASGLLPDSGGGFVYSYATLTEDNWMTLALKHLGLRYVSPKNATMSTEAMLTWTALARQRLRWKRGAFEDLLSFGLTRHTLKGWGLQLGLDARSHCHAGVPRQPGPVALAGLPPEGVVSRHHRGVCRRARRHRRLARLAGPAFLRGSPPRMVL